jgi:methylmalonyl-CoA/ethylmalonyl-CoA epimerase
LGGRVLFGGVNPMTGYRALHIGYPNGGRVELLDPAHGSDFLTKFLAARPQGGIHHLTFRVDDLHECLDRAEALAIPVFGVNFELEWQHEAFVHPREAHGTLIQFVERLKPQPQPFTNAELSAFIGA